MKVLGYVIGPLSKYLLVFIGLSQKAHSTLSLRQILGMLHLPPPGLLELHPLAQA